MQKTAMLFGLNNRGMEFIETQIKGSYIIKTNSFKDDRGAFTRLFCQKKLEKINFTKNIVQINHSFTKQKGAVRGLHFQKPPFTETKIIKCLKGAVLDIIVDIRKNSETFLQYFATELNQNDDKMIFILDGFAHGFQTLKENTELLYFHTEFYNKEHESALNILDPKLNIKLPLNITEMSERDKAHSFIDENFTGITL